MKVTVIDIRCISGTSKLKAFIDIMVEDSLIIKGFSIMSVDKKEVLLFPRKPTRAGQWFDLVVPINDNVKAQFEDVILRQYLLEKKLLKKRCKPR